MSIHPSRRKFLGQIGLAGASTLGFPAIVRAQNQNSKLQVGFVAAGGRGSGHVGAAHGLGLQCIAFTEVDKGRWDPVHSKAGWGEAKGYTDWRQMFEKHGKELDVVFVATPDHSHYSLHREAAHVVGARGAVTRRGLQEEFRRGHPDG
jgi:hypothetical protein